MSALADDRHRHRAAVDASHSTAAMRASDELEHRQSVDGAAKDACGGLADQLP
jgi:hypothetical protein